LRGEQGGWDKKINFISKTVFFMMRYVADVVVVVVVVVFEVSFIKDGVFFFQT